MSAADLAFGPEPRPIPAHHNNGRPDGSPEITLSAEQIFALDRILHRHGGNAARINVRRGERMKATELFVQVYGHTGGWTDIIVVRPSGRWAYCDGSEQWH